MWPVRAWLDVALARPVSPAPGPVHWWPLRAGKLGQANGQAKGGHASGQASGQGQAGSQGARGSLASKGAKGKGMQGGLQAGRLAASDWRGAGW